MLVKYILSDGVSQVLSKTHKDKKRYKASDLFNEKVKKGGAVI
jgi:hypothetical protein